MDQTKGEAKDDWPSPLKKAVRLYQGFQVFITVLLWVPIFYVYQKQSGLSESDYFQIQSLYYFIFCFLEIPTGYISDRWGHRSTLVASASIMAASNLVVIFFTSYQGFLFHFLLIAIARALSSGAASAYLFEYLQEHGYEKLYKKIEGEARSYSLILRTVGWSSVGYMMSWHLTSPYWGTFVACGLAALCAGLLPKTAVSGASNRTAGLLAGIRPVFEALFQRGQRRLLQLMFLGVGVFVLSRLSQVNLYQPVLTLKGFELGTFGWLMAAMTLVEAIGSNQAHRLAKWFSDLSVMYIATLVVCLGLGVVIPFENKLVVVCGYLLFALGFGISFPVLRQLLNESIPDNRYRATLLSVESIINRAVCGIAAIGAGHYVAKGLIWPFLMVSIVFSVVLVSVVVFLLSKR